MAIVDVCVRPTVCTVQCLEWRFGFDVRTCNLRYGLSGAMPLATDVVADVRSQIGHDETAYTVRQ